MLRFLDECRSRSGRWSRREWLRLAGLGGLSLAAGEIGAAEQPASRGRGFGRAKSVVLVFANGGESQLDMGDPKPDAPLDVGGPFQPIATSMPGVQFCEHLPQVAKIADRCTIVRSMSHEDLDHGSAAYLALTGVYHARRSGNPPPTPNDIPTYGAVLRRIQRQPRFVSDAIHVNGPALVPREAGPGQNGGFLGRAYEPLVVGDPDSRSEARR